MTISKNRLLCAVLCCTSFAMGSETIEVDKLSVTATKIERATKEVSESIAVIDEKEVEDKNILWMSEAINTIPGVIAESSSSSSSPRLIIRGAGLKARYGVREIMVVKDGVPMTDPDSFTRFDFIDMQDVEAVEIQKGPGSIHAANATGGVIQLLTKSVFSEPSNRVKLGVGNFGSYQTNVKYGDAIDDNNFFSTTLSATKNDNSWRDNNKVDTKQVSLKYGHIFEDEATLEGEVSYTESNIELPASMTEAEFATFKSTGEQKNTSSMWQHSARDSKILFVNAKYEKEIGDMVYKPRVYMNKWEHFHPVTSMINDSDDNIVLGTDLEANYMHKLFNSEASLVFGVTAKQDRTRDAKKYEYADINASGTQSDRKGQLANVEDSTALLYGAYIQESFKPTEKTLVDLSLRVDKIKFDVDGHEYRAYNWTTNNGTYKAGDGAYAIDESYTLFSPKLGFNYELNDTQNIYFSVASANQAPTDNELKTNRVENKGSLEKTKSTNYEVGLKTRDTKYSYDVAVYQNDINDEVVSTKEGWTTFYQNAGKTQKRGLELTGEYHFTNELSFGASYAYSNYKFKEFMEEGTNDRAGNYLPYIPQHKYSLFSTLRLANGFKARVETKSSGSYYMDNANTEKYEGYKFVTDMMLGYTKQKHSFQFNVNNVFDKHYAMQVEKNTSGVKSYKAASPRRFMATYTYRF